MEGWDDIYKIQKDLTNWAQNSGAEKNIRLLRYLVRIIRTNAMGPKILDIGCSVGHMSNGFSRMGFEVTGIDGSAVAIQRAKQSYPDIRFIESELAQFPNVLGEEKFDVLYCRQFSPIYNAGSIENLVDIINGLLKFLSQDGVMVLQDSLVGGRSLGTTEALRAFKNSIKTKTFGPFYQKPFLLFPFIAASGVSLCVTSKLFELMFIKLFKKKAQFILLMTRQ